MCNSNDLKHFNRKVSIFYDSEYYWSVRDSHSWVEGRGSTLQEAFEDYLVALQEKCNEWRALLDDPLDPDFRDELVAELSQIGKDVVWE